MKRAGGWAALGVAVSGVLLLTRPLAASQEFPGALYEAAEMQCVPLCNMCHTVNPGTSTTFGGPLGRAMFSNGARQNDPDSLKAAFAEYAKTADQATLALIRAGREPSTGQDVCGPTYGCAVGRSKAPEAPRDRTAPLMVLGAALAAALVRRRNSSR